MHCTKRALHAGHTFKFVVVQFVFIYQQKGPGGATCSARTWIFSVLDHGFGPASLVIRGRC
jgi:hypothetical protein